MLTRKLVPILVIIMLSMMIAPSVASATTKNTKFIPATELPIIIPVNQTQTYLEVYDYSKGLSTDNNSPAINEIAIYKGQRCIAAARLFNVYNESLPLKMIRYELSNSKGTIIKRGCEMTHLTIPQLPFKIFESAIFDLGKLPLGTYTLKVFYKGNEKRNLAPCAKYVKIHVIPHIIY